MSSDLSHIFGSGIAKSYSSSSLTLWGMARLFSKMVSLFYIIVFYSLQQKWMRAPISPHSHQHLSLSIILIMAFLVYVKVWFAFLWGLWMLGIFTCASWSIVSFLWRNPVLDFFFKSLLNLLQYCFFLCLGFFGQEARGILPPWSGIEPTLLV